MDASWPAPPLDADRAGPPGLAAGRLAGRRARASCGGWSRFSARCARVAASCAGAARLCPSRAHHGGTGGAGRVGPPVTSPAPAQVQACKGVPGLHQLRARWRALPFARSSKFGTELLDVGQETPASPARAVEQRVDLRVRPAAQGARAAGQLGLPRGRPGDQANPAPPRGQRVVSVQQRPGPTLRRGGGSVAVPASGPSGARR